MLRERYPCYVAGAAVDGGDEIIVTNKYTGEPAARVGRADPVMLERAIAGAAAAAEPMRKLPSHARQAVLNHVVQRVTERHEELAQALAIEAGKPIRDSRGEVTRLIDTFRYAAEESVRLGGEYLPLDISPRATGRVGIVRRFPIGACALITPFNFPMNLVAHKVAPALAVGCPWVLKPATATPIGALILAEIIAETDLPDGAFSVLPCSGKDAAPLVQDERLKFLSFTGSAEVGWSLKRDAGKKKVSLELGGNAPCIVDRDADLDYAAERITFGAFYQSGQSCVSVQRVLAHREVYAALRERLLARACELKMGDPLNEDTFIGPLITRDDAERVESWVNEATAAGASIACGGRRDGALYAATYLEDVDPAQKVSAEEVFGPVATLTPFDRFDDAVRLANDSRFGLQAGVFTRDLHHAWYAYEHLDVGGVIINDVPSWRVDHMPYGGVKDSGLGREGLRYAMEEMTELKLMVLNNPGML